MIPNSPEEYAAEILEKPDYFTVVRFRGRGQYHRSQFATFAEAAEAAAFDRRAMIYAVRDQRECLVNERGEPAVGARK